MHQDFLRSLQSKLIPLLARADRLASQWLEGELLKHGITLADFRLVGALLGETDGLTQRQLATRLSVEPATLSTAVAKLERAGVVERRPHPDDARAKCVRLASDLPQLAAVQTAVEQLERRALVGIAPQERALARQILLHIIANLSSSADNHQ